MEDVELEDIEDYGNQHQWANYTTPAAPKLTAIQLVAAQRRQQALKPPPAFEKEYEPDCEWRGAKPLPEGAPNRERQGHLSALERAKDSLEVQKVLGISRPKPRRVRRTLVPDPPIPVPHPPDTPRPTQLDAPVGPATPRMPTPHSPPSTPVECGSPTILERSASIMCKHAFMADTTAQPSNSTLAVDPRINTRRYDLRPKQVKREPQEQLEEAPPRRTAQIKRGRADQDSQGEEQPTHFKSERVAMAATFGSWGLNIDTDQGWNLQLNLDDVKEEQDNIAPGQDAEDPRDWWVDPNEIEGDPDFADKDPADEMYIGDEEDPCGMTFAEVFEESEDSDDEYLARSWSPVGMELTARAEGHRGDTPNDEHQRQSSEEEERYPARKEVRYLD